MKFLRFLPVVAAVLGFAAPARAVTNTIVSLGSYWTYLDDGSNQGTNWAQFGFNDGAWSFGQGKFGYGQGDELTTVRSNRLDGTRIITTYFRYNFELNNPEVYTVLRLRVKRDDGVAV